MYEIKVLSNEEFDSLPYPEMETSLGVADPKTKTAYVRYTGLNEVDKYLINHELEHLIEGHGGEHSNHYRNGVYYKGFGEILQTVSPAFSLIPGIGPLLGAGSAIGGSAIAGNQAKKKAKSMGDGGFQPQSSPMNAFEAPQVSTPNISQAGGSGGFGQTPQGALGGSQGGSPIERIRGFFSSRNPQGGF